MNKRELIEKIKKMDSYMFNFRPHINETQVLNYIRQLDEPQKVQVPLIVADWIEVCKEHLPISLHTAMDPNFMKQNNQSSDLMLWIKKSSNQEIFAQAWIFGYTVEKEKRYYVRMKGVVDNLRLLRHNSPTNTWTIGSEEQCFNVSRAHTRKELEKSGFGWVFNCPGMEVEEVRDDSKI